MSRIVDLEKTPWLDTDKQPKPRRRSYDDSERAASGGALAGVRRWKVTLVFGICTAILVAVGLLPNKTPSVLIQAPVEIVRESLRSDFYIANAPSAVANSTEILASANSAYNIVEFARHVKRDEDSFVTVTFASYTYRDSLINWLIAAERVNVRSVVVVCLDTALQNYLDVRGIPCFHAYATENEHDNENLDPIGGNADGYDENGDENSDSGLSQHSEVDKEDVRDNAYSEDQEDEYDRLEEEIREEIDSKDESAAGAWKESGTDELSKNKIHKLWIMRVNYLSALLHSGIDVLFSDLDAVLMQDPRPYIALGEIVASRGKFPGFAYKKWGSTVCMGFAFFRSTPNVKIILEDMVELLQRRTDDQVAINSVLLRRLGPKYKKVWGEMPSLKQESHAISKVHGKPGQVKLVLLSHYSLPRFCTHLLAEDWNGDIVAAHCRPHTSRRGELRETVRDLSLAHFNLFCDSDALAGHRIAGFVQDSPRFRLGKLRHPTHYTDPRPESMLIAAETPADHLLFAQWLKTAATTCDFGSFVKLPSKRGLVVP